MFDLKISRHHSAVILTVCVEMHPVNGTNGTYDAERYLQLIHSAIDFDR